MISFFVDKELFEWKYRFFCVGYLYIDVLRLLLVLPTLNYKKKVRHRSIFCAVYGAKLYKVSSFYENAIKESQYRQKFWFLYVDDTIVIWEH